MATKTKKAEQDVEAAVVAGTGKGVIPALEAAGAAGLLELGPVAKLVLAKLYPEKAAKEVRDGVVAGEYEVDEVVHVKAHMTVGEDYLQNIQMKSRPMVLAALFMSKVNAETRQAVCDEYAKMIKQAMDLGGDKDAIEAIFAPKEEEIKAEAEKALAKLIKLTQMICHGKVTVKVEKLERMG
jgi:hypothetical protein